MNEDYHDILSALLAQNARFIVVGAHALAAHGYPRATVDIDIWIDATSENARRVWKALAEFGAPLEDPGIREEDLTRPDVVAQAREQSRQGSRRRERTGRSKLRRDRNL